MKRPARSRGNSILGVVVLTTLASASLLAASQVLSTVIPETQFAAARLATVNPAVSSGYDPTLRTVPVIWSAPPAPKPAREGDKQECEAGNEYKVVMHNGKPDVQFSRQIVNCKDTNNSQHEMCKTQKGSQGPGYGLLTYDLLGGEAGKPKECYPGEDPKAAVVARIKSDMEVAQLAWQRCLVSNQTDCSSQTQDVLRDKYIQASEQYNQVNDVFGSSVPSAPTVGDLKAEVVRNTDASAQIGDIIASPECDRRCHEEAVAQKAALDARNAELQKELKERTDALANNRSALSPPGTPGAPATPGVPASVPNIDAFGNDCSKPGADKTTCPGSPTFNQRQDNIYQGPCQPGQTGTFPNCVSPRSAERPGGDPGPAQPPPQEKSGGGGGGLGQLGQLLGGLMQGLGKALGGATAPACPSDPNAYARQQQEYQMQMQQYNLALQQYNYQQQISALTGMPRPIPPTPPTPCRMTEDSNTCPTPPAQPPASNCPDGRWQPVTSQQSNGRQCTTSWQCVPTAGPTAQISCQPQVADVGMTVAIAYSCGNSTGSTGQGFDTGNRTSGSATHVLEAPPAGATAKNFGIVCRDQARTASAQCSVQIARPSIVLVVNPKVVVSGASSTVGWITSGMNSCVVSSPDLPAFTIDNATNKSVNGAATTPPLTSAARIVLECITLGGSTRTASTTISIAP